MGLVSQWFRSNYWWDEDQFWFLTTGTTVQGIFVENMEFECDVLVLYVLTEYGLTCEIVCEISGSELENPGCMLLLM